jgi:PIN domain nuclease of toxin-antitoxin system
VTGGPTRLRALFNQAVQSIDAEAYFQGNDLRRDALAACQSTENSLHLSLASVWELQIKMQLGKLTLRLPLADVLRDQQQQNGLVLEPVTLEDILALSALPALHRDPFDRLIIVMIVTVDSAYRCYQIR